MKKTRFSMMLLLVCALAGTAFAALSPEYAGFATGPADLLLTKEERRAWQNVRTDEEAKKFIDLFWARRDPSPGTAANEFREAVDERIRIADARFSTARAKGSVTDRGKTFVLLGSPTSMRRSGNPGGGTIQSPTSSMPSAPSNARSLQEYGSREMWIYEQAKIDYLQFNQPVVNIGFLDQYNGNEWKRERVQGTDYASLFERIANSYIVEPNLTEAPTFVAAAPAPAPAAVVPVTVAPVGVTAFTNEAFLTAVEQARAATKPSETVYLTYGEYVTAGGQHFVPVELYAPKATGLTADAPVTFFGRVEKAEGGETVVMFEEPVTLTASGDAVTYGRSLTLEPGSYRATFGLARDGKPVAVVSEPVTIQGVDHTAPSMSQLLLSSNVYPLPAAQNPTDPFAFGGLKVVPKGDGVFRQSEDLWYFIEARNPGIDPATSLPKVTMKVTIEGKTTEGKKVKMAGAAETAQAIEIKGVAGHWGLGQALPLASFKPGDYTIAIQVKDQMLDKSYELKESFRVVP